LNGSFQGLIPKEPAILARLTFDWQTLLTRRNAWGLAQSHDAK
jgi:hypothetical protein